VQPPWHRLKTYSILNIKSFGINDPNGPENTENLCENIEVYFYVTVEKYCNMRWQVLKELKVNHNLQCFVNDLHLHFVSYMFADFKFINLQKNNMYVM
jgi:hypothetical protein